MYNSDLSKLYTFFRVIHSTYNQSACIQNTYCIRGKQNENTCTNIAMDTRIISGKNSITNKVVYPVEYDDLIASVTGTE